MGIAIARSTAIFLLIAAVPVVLALPVATCRPDAGELPGINCLPAAALALLGPVVFGLVVGMLAAGAGRSGGGRSAIRALAALASGGLILLGLPHDLVIGHRVTVAALWPVTVLAPLIAFGIGALLGARLGPGAHSGREPPPTGGDTGQM